MFDEEHKPTPLFKILFLVEDWSCILVILKVGKRKSFISFNLHFHLQELSRWFCTVDIYNFYYEKEKSGVEVIAQR